MVQIAIQDPDSACLSSLILLQSSLLPLSITYTEHYFSRSSLKCHLSQGGLAGLPCLKLGWGSEYTCTCTHIHTIMLFS